MRGGDIAARRVVLVALIDRIVPVRVGHGKYDVDIVWAPLSEGLHVALDPARTDRGRRAA